MRYCRMNAFHQRKRLNSSTSVIHDSADRLQLKMLKFSHGRISATAIGIVLPIPGGHSLRSPSTADWMVWSSCRTGCSSCAIGRCESCRPLPISPEMTTGSWPSCRLSCYGNSPAEARGSYGLGHAITLGGWVGLVWLVRNRFWIVYYANVADPLNSFPLPPSKSRKARDKTY